MTTEAIRDAIMADGDLTFRLALRGGAREVAEMIANGRGVAMVRAEALEEAARVAEAQSERLLDTMGRHLSWAVRSRIEAAADQSRMVATAIRALADVAGDPTP